MELLRIQATKSSPLSAQPNIMLSRVRMEKEKGGKKGRTSYLSSSIYRFVKYLFIYKLQTAS